MLDITPICNILFALISAVLSAFLIPFIKSRISKSNQEKLAQLVKIAVTAAEQIAQLTTGPDKKAFVIDFLNRHGYTLKTSDLGDELNALIEAAVYELNIGNL